MRWKSHVRFGGRAGETDQPRSWHRAPVRSHWATKALDEVRREVWNAARKQGQTAVAKELKNARYALWKNPEDLTARQGAKLASIAQTNKRLYRAYLLN
jgi:transposase